MAALVAVEAVVIALLGLLVVGLLRSHAEILKALHDLGAPLGESHGDEPSPAGHEHAVAGPGIAPTRRPGAAAPAITGTTPSGDALAVSVSPVPYDTLLAFLSGGCGTCRDLWSALRAGRSGADLPWMRVVVVTRGEDAESPSAVAELSQGAPVPVVMSSEAWQAYRAPGAPYFVHVDGASGRIAGEGAVSSWEQMVEFVRQARADQGERRADRELTAAGIVPGDPRLHHPVEGAPADDPEAP